MPSIPMTRRFEVILSPDLMASGAEDEARESFPKEGTESEQPRMVAMTHSDEMPETLRASFWPLCLRRRCLPRKVNRPL
jgi:hypothetical protein